MIITHPDLKVVIGSSGSTNNIDWLHTEESDLNLLRPSDWAERFNPNSIAAILAEHVWEHFTYEEGILAAKTCYAFLQPGGYIRCAVPDRFFQNTWYQKMVQIGGPGPADHPAASHKIVHTYHTLTNMFETAGFQVVLLEYCDEGGNFHDNDWDEHHGFIYRSKRFDHRNQNGELGFVSLIVDAFKP